MKKLKLISLIFLSVICFSFYSQNKEINYTDNYGNNFIIENSELIPKPLTGKFFKKNLNGMNFKTQPYIPDLKFDYKITDFKKINRNNFKFRISQNPMSDNLEIILRYKGAKYYKIRIKRNKNKIELIEVRYLYSEI